MLRSLNRRALLTMFGATAGTAALRTTARAENFTMRMNLPNPAASVVGQASVRFAQAVERRSGGQLKIAVYPSYQLAREQETIDALVTGVIDLAVSNSSFLASLFPQYQVFDLSFLFKDLASGYRLLDGPIGQQFFNDLETKGIVGLAWGSGGLRQLETTSKAVNVPEDLKGLRIRITGGAIYTAVYQALGAIPIVIDGSENFTALQSHTIDGIDTNLDSFTTSKYYQVVKHVAMTNQNLSVLPMLGSKKKIEALPAPLQKILKEESKSIVSFWRATIATQTLEDIDILKKAGVAFNEVPHDAFRKAVQPAFAVVQARVGGDLLDRITRAVGV